MPEDTEIDTSGHPSAHRCPDGCPVRAERDRLKAALVVMKAAAHAVLPDDEVSRTDAA